ncbi:MAG: ATP-grasp domain-containing protein [Bacteroidetes bacterium]|nr:ATP-grasp domain-containing protein [Bacteroidota bacterium]
MFQSTAKVIITDVDSRKGFDVVNIMQRHYGFDCLLCSSRDFKVQLPLIYLQKVYLLRSSSYLNFEADLSILLHENKNENLVYLPVSEKPTRLLYEYIALRGKPHNLHYLLPTKENFDMTSNKFRFQKFCERHLFPVPNSYSFIDAKKGYSKPLILKPRSGEGSVGIKHIDSVDELDKLDSVEPENYIIQEKIISDRQLAGAFFLCQNGNVICKYAHQRIRTFPTNGGVTVFSKAANLPEVLEEGAKLLHQLAWDGVAMIEFMYDVEAEKWKIIELNPRIWGSILLSAFTGSEILKQYISISTNQLPYFNTTINTNVFIRWWYPFELMNFFKGHLSFSELLKLRLKNTCYINFTYSTCYRSIAYILYFTFNFKSINRFIKKLF